MIESAPPLAPGLEPEINAQLAQLPLRQLAEGSVLFRPGDEASGFVLVRDGVIDVHLTGRSGREITLYTVEPGQTCVQTTLCLLGQVSYSAEAIARTPIRVAIVPIAMFRRLLVESAGFRDFVFRSLGNRLADVTSVLEQVAFVKVEARLAQELLKRAGADGVAAVTHQELAAAIGSAREVVSRRLEVLSKQQLVTLERGLVRIVDRPGLVEMSEISDSL
jgi:CRP/FNR family transcriptional regulator, anaerobic regulatory protein